MVTLPFNSESAAKRFRLSLYHWRTRAALRDPRALDVKITLRGSTITLIHAPEEQPNVDSV